MAEKIKKRPVQITDTILRDAHQSLIATRMTTEDILPIVEKLDQVGFHALEMWGGATFDSCLRFLKEDHRSDCKIRAVAKIQNFKCYYEDKYIRICICR